MDAKTKSFILDIINSRNDLTLATLRPDGFPQANTLSYANDGMVLYFGTGRDSQKVRNIQYCKKVSLTIDVPYADWNEIRGLSMGALAEVLPDDSAESAHATQVLTKKYPAVWDMPPPDLASILFVKIVPKVISVLDYRKGFGHTELVEVQAGDLSA
ncbi:MAG TPA: pyridoxamine 5'-phosphate oxidase family protein [Burkholderiales bacterium]|nr:pyridoxamine 5'-phosphate oxidase family protein [Burkholderiales bacterium]